MAKFANTTQCSVCDLKTNLFRFLTDEQLTEINSTRHEVKFHKNETIFKQGGPLTHITCLTSGKAKVYIEGHLGKNIILKILKPSEMVGGPGFYVDYRHHFSVTALTESTACFIDARAFEKMLKLNSAFAAEFIKYLNTFTIKLYSKMISLTHKQMHGRIADALLYLSKEVYQNNEFQTLLSRQDLADLSAMTKESAIRILKELKDEGIIEFSTNQFRILKEEALLKISKTG